MIRAPCSPHGRPGGAGRTPAEALRAATAVAAAEVGADERLGMVEVGKEADLVLLGGSRFADIGNTREVDPVTKRGRAFDPADLDPDLSPPSRYRNEQAPRRRQGS